MKFRFLKLQDIIITQKPTKWETLYITFKLRMGSILFLNGISYESLKKSEICKKGKSENKVSPNSKNANLFSLF